MRITAALLAIGSASWAFPAAAADSRIVTHRFNADEVVAIHGRSGVQASIVLDEDEHIENVAIGDSTSWQVTPNKRANVLFIKPLSPRAQTNMTVISDRRTYFFDLLAGQRANPLYVLRFIYPDAPKAAAAPKSAEPAAQPVLTETEALAAAGKVQDATIDPARLNFAWAAKGKAALLPVRVYDDGQSTFLSWAAKVPIPAMQVRSDAGIEGPVNFAVRDDVVVIDGVPDLIVLRSGHDVATLKRNTPAARLDVPEVKPQATALAAVPARPTDSASPTVTANGER
jgi:type IV secretion system protein VirB9